MSQLDLNHELHEKLDDLTVQYGSAGAKLALAMELMSDAEISAGLLTVYCRNGLDRRKPHPDLEKLQKDLNQARTLIRAAFREDRAEGKVAREALMKADWE